MRSFTTWIDCYPGSAETIEARTAREAIDQYVARYPYHHGEIIEACARTEDGVVSRYLGTATARGLIDARRA